MIVLLYMYLPSVTVCQSDSFVWREQSKLKAERDLFLDQRKDFEKEKQQFMEAVYRLDREVQEMCHCVDSNYKVTIIWLSIYVRNYYSYAHRPLPSPIYLDL